MAQKKKYNWFQKIGKVGTDLSGIGSLITGLTSSFNAVFCSPFYWMLIFFLLVFIFGYVSDWMNVKLNRLNQMGKISIYIIILGAFIAVALIIPKGNCESTTGGSVNRQLEITGSGNTTLQGDVDKDAHVVIGENNGINGNVYVTPAPPPRHIDPSDISKLLGLLPSRTSLVHIESLTNDDEGKVFGNQIFETLTKHGYLNLAKGEISRSQPQKKDRFSVDSILVDKQKEYIVNVPSQK